MLKTPNTDGCGSELIINQTVNTTTKRCAIPTLGDTIFKIPKWRVAQQTKRKTFQWIFQIYFNEL